MANLKNYTDNTVISGTGSNDYILNRGDRVSINAYAGNDSITNSEGANTSIVGGEGNDSITNSDSDNVTILAGADDDYIYNRSSADVSINAGTGSDTISNYEGDNLSIYGGAGNDLISLSSLAYDNVIVYNEGDGKDKIYGFKEDDTLKISSSSYSTQESGDNVIITVGDGKISLFGALAYVSPANIDFEKTKPATSWTLDGTTATYGSLTIKGVTSLDGILLDGKVVTISAASLGTKKISVSDGYTLKLGSDVSSSTTKKSWTLKNSTATYKQTTTAGYSLVDNEIIYSKKSSKTLATVKGVESLDGLSVSGKVITVSAESLGTEKISVSGTGYTLALGDDVKASTTKKSWTLKNSTATYKQTTTAGYSLVDNEIIYSKKISKTLATVKGVNDKSGLKVSGSTIKLSGDALSKKVTVSGAYTFDFDSDFKNATVTGSSSADTIIARGKNIFVKGGAGSDVFSLKSTGTISDYEEADKISLTGAAKISVSGSDVIFGGKITVAGAADKSVTYIEGGVEKIFKKASDDVKYNAAGTGATLTAKYSADEFTPNEYSDFADMLKTIDASAVDYNLKIVGNKRANKIIGGEEDDFIDGAAGFDTLFGGDGSDVFVYKAGDGKIFIEDFDDALDKIRVLSGDVNSPTVDKAGDVTFAVDDGQIVVKGGANKYIPIYFGKGNKNIVMKYTPR